MGGDLKHQPLPWANCRKMPTKLPVVASFNITLSLKPSIESISKAHSLRCEFEPVGADDKAGGSNSTKVAKQESDSPASFMRSLRLV